MLIAQTNQNSACTTEYIHNLQWNPVASPDGHPVEYYLQIDTVTTFDSVNLKQSNWISATNWSTPSLTAGTTWYWRVKARDAVHIAMESSYSGNGSFIDTNSWSCECDNSCDTSCPILFAWDGKKYAYESDIYPAGKLGNMDPKGFRKPNPFDYYLLASKPEVKNGTYELRLVEEKIEANYLDNIKLYAVEIPDDRNIYAERLPITGGKYVKPEQVLHTVGMHLRKPLSVKHLKTGEDVTDRLSVPGDQYVVLSKNRNSDFGWQTLEIDLGDLSAAPMIKLVIDGATAFPNTHAGHQIANKWLAKAKIEVLDSDGNWVAVPMKDRSIVLRDGGGPTVINITSIFKSKVYKLRLSYLYKTYVKSIMYDTTIDEPVIISEVPLSSAELAYHGHDASTSVSKDEVVKYIYGTSNNQNPKYLTGYYTRFGDVTPLLRNQDDKFVVFGSGDEIVLRFNQLKKGPEGTSRRFLIYSNGYYKSLSNRNVSPTVAPMPFAGMSNFPYDEDLEGFPNDTGYQEYKDHYNTRLESGPSKQGRGSPIEEKKLASTNSESTEKILKAEPVAEAIETTVQEVVENAKSVPLALDAKMLQGGTVDEGEVEVSIWGAIRGYASKILTLIAYVWGWIVNTLT